MSNPRQLIIGLSVAALAIFFTFRNIPANELLAAFRQAEYIYLFPVALIVLTSYIVRVYRWQVLVAHVKPVTIGQLPPPMMVGFLGNMLPMRARRNIPRLSFKEKNQHLFHRVSGNDHGRKNIRCPHAECFLHMDFNFPFGPVQLKYYLVRAYPK